MIYFVGCPAADAVKIGFTAKRGYLAEGATAYERLAVLQVGCPLELELLATCDGGKAEEAALHARFAQHHLRGDWFAFTGELREHVEQLTKPERLVRGWHSQARNRKAA